MDADPKHAACYHHHLGLIRELFALVPERLQNKLTWRGPDDSTCQDQLMWLGQDLIMKPRTIAIGDIHGCSAAFDAVLEAICPGR